jgi:hypothetical protein
MGRVRDKTPAAAAQTRPGTRRRGPTTVAEAIPKAADVTKVRAVGTAHQTAARSSRDRRWLIRFFQSTAISGLPCGGRANGTTARRASDGSP